MTNKLYLGVTESHEHSVYKLVLLSIIQVRVREFSDVDYENLSVKLEKFPEGSTFPYRIRIDATKCSYAVHEALTKNPYLLSILNSGILYFKVANDFVSQMDMLMNGYYNQFNSLLLNRVCLFARVVKSMPEDLTSITPLSLFYLDAIGNKRLRKAFENEYGVKLNTLRHSAIEVEYGAAKYKTLTAAPSVDNLILH